MWEKSRRVALVGVVGLGLGVGMRMVAESVKRMSGSGVGADLRAAGGWY